MNRREIATALGSEIVSADSVSGGDINDAHRVELADKRIVFVKSNDDAPAGMFAAEAAGLDWLRAGPRGAHSLRVPEVIAIGDRWLALEWLDLGGRPDPVTLGRGLAELHRSGAPCFGLDAPNFLATLPQDNTPEDDWPTFYVERRLRPLCRRAKLALDRELDRLRQRADVFGPAEPPARLHGDLWWGNVGSTAVTTTGASTTIATIAASTTAASSRATMSASSPQAVILDPAVYGGHREIDLAMLALFGGLPDALVASYDEVFPLADGWRERIALHQLYPLAAHACLFGGSYGAQVKSTLARFK